MDLKEWGLLIGGGTGLAALVAALTKYLTDRRTLDYAQRVKEWDMLVARIVKLESDHEDCMTKNSDLSQILGQTRGELHGLKVILGELERGSRAAVAERTAEKTAEKALAKFEEAVTNAAEKAVDTPPPAKE